MATFQDEFERKLTKLKNVNPGHDMISVIESMGPTYLSMEYLKIALEDPILKTREEVTADALFRQKGALYSRRAVLSNKFHTCETDAERYEISYAIGSIQTEIVNNRRIIESYIETGRVPKMPDKKIMPLDGRRKEKKLHSVRTSISRYKGLIRKEQDPEKIKKYETAITRLDVVAGELSA